MSALFLSLAIVVICLLWWLARPDKNERILAREYELLEQADQRVRAARTTKQATRQEELAELKTR